jgi:lipopolysaccharide biosynthesis protein
MPPFRFPSSPTFSDSSSIIAKCGQIAIIRRKVSRMLHSVYTDLKRRILFRLRGPDRPQRPGSGVARSSDQDWSVAVPFEYAMTDVSVRKPIGVICHLFHEDLALEFRLIFENIPFPTDVFITTDTEAKRALITSAFEGWSKGQIDIRTVLNRGRDIAPKLAALKELDGRYDILLFLHSKKSLENLIGTKWRQALLQTLAGSPEIVRSIMDIFQRQPNIGMIIPQHFESIRPFTGWNGTFEVAYGLAQRMNIDLSLDHILDFPSGSMFWARSGCFTPLLDLNLKVEDFAPEGGQVDGTIAHAVERLFLFVCEKAGYSWIKVADPAYYRMKSSIEQIKSRKALDRFLAVKTLHLTNSVLASPSEL